MRCSALNKYECNGDKDSQTSYWNALIMTKEHYKSSYLAVALYIYYFNWDIKEIIKNFKHTIYYDNTNKFNNFASLND